MVVLYEFEAVPVLSVEHVAALVLLLHSLVAVEHPAVCVRVLGALRLLLPGLFLNLLKVRRHEEFFLRT